MAYIAGLRVNKDGKLVRDRRKKPKYAAKLSRHQGYILIQLFLWERSLEMWLDQYLSHPQRQTVIDRLGEGTD